MNAMGYLWFAAGIGGGALHGASLWRAIRRNTEWAAALGLVRLMAVAALLVAAGVSRALLPAALGWALGFAGVFAALLCGRKP